MGIVVVDNAMVKRAQHGFSCRPDGSFQTPYPNAADTKRMLEAALNPPPEPEIPVSAAMLDAGIKAAGEHWQSKNFNTIDQFKSVYTAMERKRREEQGPSVAPCGVSVPEATEMTGESCTVAVGRVPNRSDGLLSLHVGPSWVWLDQAEAHALVQQIYRLDRRRCFDARNPNRRRRFQDSR